MGQKKSGNEHILRARSERLEGLLDLYTRGVIDIDDFIRLKTQVKIPVPTTSAIIDPDSLRSGSTKKQELRQIRDEIRRREHAASDQADIPRGQTDISLYSNPLPSAEKFSTEPMIAETSFSELQSSIHKSVPPAVIGKPDVVKCDPEPAKESGLSRSGMWISSSMAAVSRSPRSVAALAITFLIASALTIGIARSGPVNEFVNTLQPQNSAASSFISQASANSFIQPQFGPQAVRRCLDICLAANSDEVCGRACNHLTLSEFARRITAQEINPAEESRKSAVQCETQAHRRLAEIERTEWMKMTNELVEILQHADENRTVSDFSRARLEHDRLSQLNETIAVPKSASLSERTLAGELARASCLRVNLNLSEMALVLARQGSDPLSERFYQRYYEQLHTVASNADRNVSGLVKKISALEHAQ